MASSHPTQGRLNDRIAIVTGGASGIGRAIALALANEGAHVVVADMRDTSRNPKESSQTTHEAVKSLGRKSTFIQTDVTSSESIDALVAAVVKDYGRLDIMCNNAGAAFEVHAEKRFVWEMENETWQKTLDLNCNGVFFGIRAASKVMMGQEPLPGGKGDRGWIINTASVMGLVATKSAAAYCSSKHLVLGLTKAAALDLAPSRIHVNAICPGWVDSAFATYDEATRKGVEFMHPFGQRMGLPDDIAGIAVFLASDDAKWVHGTGIVVDGGYIAQ